MGQTSCFASFPIVLCCALLLGACSDAADRNDLIDITGPTMGTTYAVKLYDSNGDTDTDTLQPQADGPSARGADALATAMMVLGPEEGYRLAEREALAVQLFIRSGDGFRVLATTQFESYLLR